MFKAGDIVIRNRNSPYWDTWSSHCEKHNLIPTSPYVVKSVHHGIYLRFQEMPDTNWKSVNFLGAAILDKKLEEYL